MANLQERLISAVDTAEIDTSLLHNIVHGSDTSIVTTEGGDVPTVAKAIKDIKDKVYNQTYNLVETAQNAANIATQKASECCDMTQEVINYTQQNSEYTANMKIWMEGSDEEVQKLGGKHSCEQWVKLAQQSTTGSYPTIISGIAYDNQTLLNLGNTLSVSNQILSVIIENTLLLPSNYTLSEDYKSVRLFNPLSHGERWSVQYLTDFQSIASIDNNIIYEDMEVVNE